MDIIDNLEGLYTQATKERSHFYVADVVEEAITEITALRKKNSLLVERITNNLQLLEPLKTGKEIHVKKVKLRGKR